MANQKNNLVVLNKSTGRQSTVAATDAVQIGGDLKADGSLLSDGAYVTLNLSEVDTTGSTGGIVVVHKAVGPLVNDTVAGSYTTSTVTTTSTDAFTAVPGAFISITESTTGNDGIYEVVSHAANLLTIDMTPGEAFAKAGFLAGSGDGALITHVEVTVIRSDIAGAWEIGNGNATGLSYSDIATSIGAGTLQTAYDNGNGTIITDATGAITFTLSADSQGFSVQGNGAGDGDVSIGGATAVSSVTVDTTGAIGMTADAASNFTVDGAQLQLATTTSGELDLTSAGLMDVNAGANLDVDVTGTLDILATGTFSVDGTGDSNVTATSGTLTLSTLTSGDVSLDSVDSVIIDGAEAAIDAVRINASDAAGGIDIDAGTGGIDVLTAGALSIDSAADSNLTVTNSIASTNATLTVKTDNAGAVAGDATLDLIATSTNGAAVINITADDTINMETTGSTVNVADTAVAQTVNVGTGAATMDINVGSSGNSTAVDVLGNAASSFAVTGAQLQLATLTSGELDLTSAGLLDVNAAANMDVDVTGTYDMLATGAFSIDGTGGSNVTATSGTLTLSTLISGDVSLDSVDSVIIDGAEAAADAVRINASDIAGGIDIDAGTGGIDVLTTGPLSLDSTGTAANLTLTSNDGADTTLTLESVNGGAGEGLIAINASSGGSVIITSPLTIITGDFDVQGTTTTVNSTVVNIADRYLYLNKDNTVSNNQSGGIVVNTSSPIGAATEAITSFAGADTIDVADSTGFVVADLVQVSGANNSANDGIYEVASLTATTIVIESTPTEDFPQTVIATDATAGGIVTKVEVSVIRDNGSGVWQTASGSTVPLTYSAVVTEDSLTLQSAYDGGETIALLDTDGDLVITIDESGSVADFRLTNGAANYLETDATNTKLVLGSSAISAILEDDTSLEFGTDSDVVMTWDNTDMDITFAANNSIVNWGAPGGNTPDIIWHGNASGDEITLDSSANLVTYDGLDLRLNNSDILEFGDAQDVQMRWDGTDFDVLAAADDSVWNWGVDNGNAFDMVWHGDATGDSVTFDASANTWTYDNVDVVLGDNDSLTFGDGADTIIVHDGTDTTVTHSGPTGSDFVIDNTNATGHVHVILGSDDQNTSFNVKNNSGTSIVQNLAGGYHTTRIATSGGIGFLVEELSTGNDWLNINATTDTMTFGHSTTNIDFRFNGSLSSTIQIEDRIEMQWGPTGGSHDWTMESDAGGNFTFAGIAEAADVAGNSLTINGSDAGTHIGTGVGVDGGSIAITAGTGNDATDNAASDAGDGGVSNIFGGVGGIGIDGTNDHDGGAGGDVNFWGGEGGISGDGAGSTGGTGGTAFLQGGTAGAAGTGGVQGDGGAVTIRGGDGVTDGSINIGDSQTEGINLGFSGVTGPLVHILSDEDAVSSTDTTAAFLTDGGAAITKDLYVGGDIILDDSTEASLTMAERSTDSATPSDGGSVYVKTAASNPELFYIDENSNITQLTGPNLSYNDSDAIHDNVAGEIAAITLKNPPVSGDLLLIEDSAAGNAKKYITVGSLPTGSGGQTNTVAGSGGITNVGTNVDADLAPTYGTTASTVTEGNDARLSDARVPTGAAGGELGGTYPNPTVNDGADGTAIHDNIAGEIAAITLKNPPVSGDLLLIEDSADSNNKKYITVGSLPTGGGGETNTASNVGTAGVGLFKQKTGVDLEFKKVNAGSSKISVTDDVGNDEVDIDVVEANLDVGNMTGTKAGVDSTAIHDNVAGEIAAIAVKGSPVGADFILIEDSAAANAKKHILISSLPGGGGAVWTVATETTAARAAASGEFVLVNAATCVITLPAPAADARVACKAIAVPATATSIEIRTSGAGILIDGTDYSASPGLPLKKKYEMVNVISDGTDWFIY